MNYREKWKTQGSCKTSFIILEGVPGQGMLLRSDSDLRVYAYCDVDWATYPLTQRSLSGYYVTIHGSLVSWKTKKQSTISKFSIEAEYHAMANVTSELIWINSFLLHFGLS